MSTKVFSVTAMFFVTLIVYLFASAPAALPDREFEGRMVPVDALLKAVAHENDSVRQIFTKEIVGAGMKSGLKFKEEWREKDVQAGPLPALFLRETAANLEKSPARLGLFLGSDFPINASNGFSGIQTEKFAEIKKDKQPQFFFAEDTQLHTAMFPDFAVADACVTCHNEHAQTPKTDWKLNDIMGATTWSYPREFVSVEEFAQVLSTLRLSFRGAYEAYLEKVRSFDQPPEIGANWPRDGYFLPSAEVFMDEVSQRTSRETLATLFSSLEPRVPQTQEPVAAMKLTLNEQQP